MTDSIYVADLTLCKCGHMAIEHYDSWALCTYVMIDDCDCDEFDAAEPERLEYL